MHAHRTCTQRLSFIHACTQHVRKYSAVHIQVALGIFKLLCSPLPAHDSLSHARHAYDPTSKHTPLQWHVCMHYSLSFPTTLLSPPSLIKPAIPVSRRRCTRNAQPAKTTPFPHPHARPDPSHPSPAPINSIDPPTTAITLGHCHYPRPLTTATPTNHSHCHPSCGEPAAQQ